MGLFDPEEITMKRQQKTYSQAAILSATAKAYGDKRLAGLVGETGELTPAAAEAEKITQGDPLMLLLASEVASLTEAEGNTEEHLVTLRQAFYRLANKLEDVGDAIYAVRLNSAQQSG